MGLNNIREEAKLNATYKTKKTENKKVLIISICVSILLIIALLLSTIFSLININNKKIINGIKISEMDVSNLSKEEAKQKLNEILQQRIDKDINIVAQDFEYQINMSQIELAYQIDAAIEEAYGVGRNSNIFSNNYKIGRAMLFGTNINLAYTYNEQLLNNLVNDIASKVPNPVVEPNYCIEDDKLIISRGTAGNSLDKEKLKEAIINKILGNDEFNINVELVTKEPDSIDIDKIYSEVYKEAKDAYFTKEPFQVYPHVDGIDFDLEATREILKEEKEEYEIELKITTPKVTTNQIGTEAFPNLLSSFTTRYDASNYPRTTNLKLAMQKLNGVVVNPGEVFSYNKTLGKRTTEAGYKEAGGFAGGRVVQTLAGGICQISSTLYDAVVYANLDVIERYNHMFLAGYVGAGKDATVVYGSLDFKFKNTRKYPIMIKTSIGNGVARVDIYGVKEEVEYDIDIVTSILSYTPYKVIREEDSSLKPGKEKVVQNGMNGCKSITYKVLKLNGVEVSREVLSSDTYDAMNKIIKYGPEKESQAESEENKKPNKEENKGQVSTETTKPNNNTTQKPNTGSNENIKPNTGTADKPSTNNPDTGSNSGTTTNPPDIGSDPNEGTTPGTGTDSGSSTTPDSGGNSGTTGDSTGTENSGDSTGSEGIGETENSENPTV